MPDSIYSGLSDSAPEKLESRDRLTLAGARVALVLGGLTLLCAVLGLAYSAGMLVFITNAGEEAAARMDSLPHFHPAFFLMWGICVTCFFALAWGGYRLLQRRLTATRLLVGVWLFELVYLFVVAVTWRAPGIGPSIAGATGVANGGLMVQYMILLPLWGPLVLWWLHRRQRCRAQPLVCA
jgi:hypothetical protein